jgi:hypothetical protein
VKETKELIDIINNLIRVLDAQKEGTLLLTNQGQALDGYSALANYNSLVEELKLIQLKK